VSPSRNTVRALAGTKGLEKIAIRRGSRVADRTPLTRKQGLWRARALDGLV
jgi:hypothetical protein